MVAADASGRAISPFEKKSKKIFEPFSLLRRLTVKRRWVASHNKEIVMFKRTIVSGLVATTVAAAMLVGTVQPSAAHHKHYNKHPASALLQVSAASCSAARSPSRAPSISRKTAAPGMSGAASIATRATTRTRTPMSGTTVIAIAATFESHYRPF
ncbi:hypothetical protein NKJ22_31150 [Mesorhizobium sp. M0220]